MSSGIDVTDYLLGELDAEGLREAKRLEREDPDFRREVERLRPVVSGLEGLPQEAWAVDAPSLLPDSERPPEDRVRSRWRLPRLQLRAPIAVAASVLLVGAGVALGLALDGSGDGTVEGADAVALEPVPGTSAGAAGELNVSYGQDGRADLSVSGLAPSGDGFYELWLLNDSDDLVSLGSFRVGDDGAARLDVPIPVDAGEYRFFDVSREPGDGNPGHSGVSVLRAPA